ncbi:hypothetical protein, partial [Klebsiella aerogenes]|uniref:hypothetical protein n=1 Tax=Klebsiella aerogenes TaxID=548 RepID=UPI001CBE18A7
LSIPTLDDALVDPGKTLTVTLTAPSGTVGATGGSLSATVSQIDNDSPLAIVATTPGNETGPVPSVFTATRGGNLTAPLKVN